MQRWLRRSSILIKSESFQHWWHQCLCSFLVNVRVVSPRHQKLLCCSHRLSKVVHQFPSKSHSSFIKLPSTQPLAALIVAMIFALLNRQKSRGVTLDPSPWRQSQAPRSRKSPESVHLQNNSFSSIRHSTPPQKNSCDSFSSESSDPSAHCQSKFTARIPWGVVVFMATHERIPVEEVEHE
jgi:hypothetical protein